MARKEIDLGGKLVPPNQDEPSATQDADLAVLVETTAATEPTEKPKRSKREGGVDGQA